MKGMLKHRRRLHVVKPPWLRRDDRQVAGVRGGPPPPRTRTPTNLSRGPTELTELQKGWRLPADSLISSTASSTSPPSSAYGTHPAFFPAIPSGPVFPMPRPVSLVPKVSSSSNAPVAQPLASSSRGGPTRRTRTRHLAATWPPEQGRWCCLRLRPQRPGRCGLGHGGTHQLPWGFGSGCFAAGSKEPGPGMPRLC